MMQKLIFLFSLTALSLLPVVGSRAAFEVVEPSALCDRFDRKSDEKKCLDFVAQKKPDTYVSSTCQTIDDNKLFMQCLEFAAATEVDPRELGTCAQEDMSDQERWSCLQKTAAKKGSKYQRLPAQVAPNVKSSGKRR